MIHIDAATLRKYPILGVLIGLAIAIVVAFLLRSGWTEVRTLLAQKAPTAMSLHETVQQTSIRWVTVTDAHWHCEDAITISRQGTIARLMFGAVEVFEVPVTATGDTAHDELLVARFDKAVSCEERAHAPLTGVVRSEEIFGTGGAVRRWSRAGRQVAVMNVDAGPSRALLLVLAMAGVCLFGVLFAAYYLRLMFRSGVRRPVPVHANSPLHPS